MAIDDSRAAVERFRQTIEAVREDIQRFAADSGLSPDLLAKAIPRSTEDLEELADKSGFPPERIANGYYTAREVYEHIRSKVARVQFDETIKAKAKHDATAAIAPPPVPESPAEDWEQKRNRACYEWFDAHRGQTQNDAQAALSEATGNKSVRAIRTYAEKHALGSNPPLLWPIPGRRTKTKR